MKFEAEGVALDGRTVVIVEDDATLRSLLSDILGELGADCLEFDNAEDALVRLLELHGNCSLIIADHGVPGSLKGMELISLAHEKWPCLPAIITSGYQLDISSLTPPAFFLFKPWSIDALVTAIKAATCSEALPFPTGSRLHL